MLVARSMPTPHSPCSAAQLFKVQPQRHSPSPDRARSRASSMPWAVLTLRMQLAPTWQFHHQLSAANSTSVALSKPTGDSLSSTALLQPRSQLQDLRRSRALSTSEAPSAPRSRAEELELTAPEHSTLSRLQPGLSL